MIPSTQCPAEVAPALCELIIGAPAQLQVCAKDELIGSSLNKIVNPVIFSTLFISNAVLVILIRERNSNLKVVPRAEGVCLNSDNVD